MAPSEVRRKPYAESTANERVRFCSTIENIFKVDLDKISKSFIEKNKLICKVNSLDKSHVNTFVHALSAYFVFAK